MNKINSYLLLLIILFFTDIYPMENSLLSRFIFNRAVNITDHSETDKGFVGCTIQYNSLTSPKIIIEKSMLIGCEVMPQEGVVNNIVNKTLFLVNNYSLDTNNYSSRELKNVIGFWVKVREGVKLQDCCIIGLEADRLPSQEDYNFIVSKNQVKYAGGVFVCFVSGLLYLLK
ncbi:hypothetical protein EKK58_10745 [Candidatus Dependentiae bacterium]|nr:MAG: hypothetical protein EKK58_10745 [Candidatus Dependentiae bacterium]